MLWNAGCSPMGTKLLPALQILYRFPHQHGYRWYPPNALTPRTTQCFSAWNFLAILKSRKFFCKELKLLICTPRLCANSCAYMLHLKPACSIFILSHTWWLAVSRVRTPVIRVRPLQLVGYHLVMAILMVIATVCAAVLWPQFKVPIYIACTVS